MAKSKHTPPHAPLGKPREIAGTTPVAIPKPPEWLPKDFSRMFEEVSSRGDSRWLRLFTHPRMRPVYKTLYSRPRNKDSYKQDLSNWYYQPQKEDAKTEIQAKLAELSRNDRTRVVSVFLSFAMYDPPVLTCPSKRKIEQMLKMIAQCAEEINALLPYPYPEIANWASRAKELREHIKNHIPTARASTKAPTKMQIRLHACLMAQYAKVVFGRYLYGTVATVLSVVHQQNITAKFVENATAPLRKKNNNSYPASGLR